MKELKYLNKYTLSFWCAWQIRHMLGVAKWHKKTGWSYRK